MEAFYDTIPKKILSRITSINNPISLYHLITKADESQECVYTQETIYEPPPMPKRENNRYFHSSISSTIHKTELFFYERLIFHVSSKESGVSRKIEILFIPIHNSVPSTSKYLPYLIKWFKLMNMLCSNEKCNNNLSIVIYLTNFKKELPLYHLNKKTPITSQHVNSAFTYACIKKGTITIYRNEEWFKVLLHECIHSFCLDFNDDDPNRGSPSTMYVTDPAYNETYTEVWAELMQCALVSYNDCSHIPVVFSLLFDCYSKLEIVHSVIQAAKVLSYYGYSFSTVREKKHFNQETHIFEYYILKALVMMNLDEFYVWCLKNNGSNIIPFSRKQEPASFYTFLQKSCSDNQIKKVNTIQKEYNDHNNDSTVGNRNLLMSIIHV